jgi:hypothetical protein
VEFLVFCQAKIEVVTVHAEAFVPTYLYFEWIAEVSVMPVACSTDVDTTNGGVKVRRRATEIDDLSCHDSQSHAKLDVSSWIRYS